MNKLYTNQDDAIKEFDEYGYVYRSLSDGRIVGRQWDGNMYYLDCPFAPGHWRWVHMEIVSR